MSSVIDYEARAFLNMLEQGMMPRPESESDARAVRKAGIRLRGSDLLLSAKLPPGWRGEPTSDPRWGQLLDDQGRERGRFFYKVHDRRGHLQMNRRYTTWNAYSGDDSQWCVRDTATGALLYESSWSEDHIAYQDVREWLDEHFPEWEDPSAYWDETAVKRPWWRFWRR